MIKISYICSCLKNSSLFKDSFWAVSGNGIGNFLMLLSGILVARFLGKDLYGEYGIVKSTMFLAALFATFGLGDTATKYVAEYVQKNVGSIKGIIISSLEIVLCFSGVLCVLLLLFADHVASFVNEPRLAYSFRFLGVIIVFRALNTVGAGLLGGFKSYKTLGINNIIGGATMLILCVPLTMSFSLHGALWALLFSQITLSILNLFVVYKYQRMMKAEGKQDFRRELITFSFPFALNEFVYTISSWCSSLFLTKYSSLGELGLLSVCSQWNAIILFMPGLLGNVILSYLSTTAVSNRETHGRLIKRMMLINLVCTLIPLVIVICASPLITRYYGPSFKGLEMILSFSAFGTLFTCLTRVYQSNLMSEGKKWTAFAIRSSYNLLSLIVTYVILIITDGVNAALNVAIAGIFINALSLVMYMASYYVSCKKAVNA